MTLNGQMIQQPLLISWLIDHAERHHGGVEVVSRRVEGDLHRETFRELAARARRLAKALGTLGVEEGDRVATMAWNGYRHMELYYAVSGSGAVLHTMNPRLHADQLVYMVRHAGDKVLFFDLTFLPLVESVAPCLTGIKWFVAMTDRTHMPDVTSLTNLLCFEDLIEAQDDDYRWPVLDENTASSVCYTSGTTGDPKGVVYSHRSTLLHSFSVAMQAGYNVADTVLPVVPMFHANAWGLPYIVCMVGAKIVFPGPQLDGKSLHSLMEGEGVTVAAGVPTVWQGLIAYMEANSLRFSTLKRTFVGGSACPLVMVRTFQETYGVRVVQGWGMTEMSPVGTVCLLKPGHETMSTEERYKVLAKQGYALFGVDMKIVSEDGKELPWDGKATGELMVRGPWVLSSYFGDERDPLVDGWFPTGDVASIDSDGYVQITDRSKDLIKSGGEWIGSVELEGIVGAHPAVAMAACIGVPHPKWQERPLLVVARRPGAQVTREELMRFYEGKVAKWWIPDDVVFVDAIPLGATGKMQKNKLRDQFKDHSL
jgi:acyl-CoA synthetase (AMP-forming)/AMP-acid ligase II